jgi:hypothetical protein
VTEDGGNGATTSPATDEEAAGARGDMGDTQVPAVSALEEDVGDDGAEVETVTSGPAEPSPATEYPRLPQGQTGFHLPHKRISPPPALSSWLNVATSKLKRPMARSHGEQFIDD